jgi:uncharacterized protein (DUF58 family)
MSGGLGRGGDPTGPTIRPTARGAAAVAVLVALVVAAAITGRSGLLPFIVLVALPLAVAPAFTHRRARRASRAQVRAMVSPPLTPVGGPSELIVQLANEGEGRTPPVGLEAPADHWAIGTTASPRQRRSNVLARVRGRGLAADPGRLMRWSALRAGGSSTATVPLPTSRRGVFVIGPLRAWVHDPFGLCAVPVAVAPAVTLVVYPARAASVTSQPVPPVHDRHHAFGGGVGVVDQDDPGGELSGLRPYVPGDRLHLLSWPVEARYGTLMVQQFRPEGQARIGLLLDDRAGVHRRAAFEAALSVLHELVLDAADQTVDVEIATLSGHHVLVTPTPEGKVEFLTFLAQARPHSVPAGSVRHRAHHAAGTVITTDTAQASLPLPGNVAVVVVE